jgi:hypothetical protein
MHERKVDTIQEACHLIENGNLEKAKATISSRYPFQPLAKSGRNYTPRAMTRIFVRDGFIDRYKGHRLVYPPALRLLSQYMPDVFPYHKNGKMSVGHLAYWELFPTIDHIDPVAREGPDNSVNLVCCSMLTNSIKSNWTLEQLGWSLLPPGDFKAWDGMTSWFLRRAKKDAQALGDPYIQKWYRAGCDVLLADTPERSKQRPA